MPSRLEAAHAANRRRISMEADRLLRRAWATSSRDEDRFVAEAAAIAESARAAVAAEIDAFLATFLTVHGVPRSPIGLVGDAYRRPVDPEVQWARPFTHLRMKLAGGSEFGPAAAFARHQASTMLATDLQFTARGAARDVVSQEPTAVGYRRVTGAAPCGLCVAASDQLYHVSTLLPIHDNCACTVVPVGAGDARYGLSDGEYQRVLEQTGGDTSKKALSKVRLGETPPADAVPFRVVEHGELGPYMFDAAHKAPMLDAAA